MVEANPRLTADQMGLYFVRPDSNSNWDIYVAIRTQVGGDFGDPVRVVGINSTANEFDPTLTTDGLTMYLDSGRSGNYDIFVATRTSVVADFSVPSPVSMVNTTDVERAVSVLPDGRALYFSRYGALSPSGERIYRAAIGSTGASAPIEVPGLEAVASRGFPVVTPDELTIYFSTSGGASGDMWMATRTSATDPFGAPTEVAGLNRPDSNEEPGWVSSDGCVLYFASTRTGNMDLYVAKRGN